MALVFEDWQELMGILLEPENEWNENEWNENFMAKSEVATSPESKVRMWFLTFRNTEFSRCPTPDFRDEARGTEYSDVRWAQNEGSHENQVS